MARYLVFQLYGPQAAWGEPAVGEVRHTHAVPSRSALLGLLAAALGIRRDEEERLNQLQAHYRFAVRILREGSWLRDYHTTQVPKENRKLHYATRKDELTLAPDELQTILSTREYRCDAYYQVAVSMTEGAPFTLEELALALQRPVFPLYLGRKSCPLGLPLAPHCLEGDLGPVFREAEQWLSKLIPGRGARCVWEGEASGVILHQSQIRQDQPLSRRRWQFTGREQHQGMLAGGE